MVRSTYDTLPSFDMIWPFTLTSQAQGVAILHAKQKNRPSTCCLIFARWHVKQVQTKGVMVGPCT